MNKYDEFDEKFCKPDFYSNTYTATMKNGSKKLIHEKMVLLPVKQEDIKQFFKDQDEKLYKKIEALPYRDSGKIGGLKLVDKDEVLRIIKCN